MGADSVLVLDNGAAANSVRYKWLGRRSNIWGIPRAETHPACARFEFGDGPLGDVRCVADIPAGVVGGRWRLIFQNCYAESRREPWASNWVSLVTP